MPGNSGAERRSNRGLTTPRSVGAQTAHTRRPNFGDALGRAIALIILLTGVVLILLGHQSWIWASSREVFVEAGYVLIGTVLVTFVYDAVLRRHHDEQMLSVLESSLVGGATRQGLIGVYEQLSFRRLFVNLKRGDTLLWLDTYCPDFPNFQEEFLDAIERGATVKMLAIRPDAQTLLMREREINRDYGYSGNASAEAALQIARLRKILISRDEMNEISSVPISREQFDLRLYNDLPCIPMYLHLRKGSAYTGFTSYFLGAPSFREPHLKWKNVADGFLQKFVDYFNQKWERASGASVCLNASCTNRNLHFVADCPDPELMSAN